ncbi:MAG: mannose-1-phosphate guanylyltransferase [Kiritimatiellia bacterium]
MCADSSVLPIVSSLPHAYAVILAGGRGERFWPLSTYHRPKQFISLFGGTSLLAQAVARLDGLVAPDCIFVITSNDLIDATRRTVPQLSPDQIIGEPMSKNTAAAVALACGLVRTRDKEGIVAILTADQLMTDVPQFKAVLADSYLVASREKAIITIGIAPTYPATGFGYIECADPLEIAEATPFHRVARFVEKPDAITAKAYLELGTFVWNAGMFIGRVNVFENAYKAHAPQYVPLILSPERKDEFYPTLPTLSIDYALMEKCSNLLVARGDFGWDDVGSLTALGTHFPADAQHNVFLSPTTAIQTENCVIASEGVNRPTALLGVSDLLVIHTDKATLICNKKHAQEIKKLIPLLPEELR